MTSILIVSKSWSVVESRLSRPAYSTEAKQSEWKECQNPSVVPWLAAAGNGFTILASSAGSE